MEETSLLTTASADKRTFTREKFGVIVSVDYDWGIGRSGDTKPTPWFQSSPQARCDSLFFRAITTVGQAYIDKQGRIGGGSSGYGTVEPFRIEKMRKATLADNSGLYSSMLIMGRTTFLLCGPLPNRCISVLTSKSKADLLAEYRKKAGLDNEKAASTNDHGTIKCFTAFDKAYKYGCELGLPMWVCGGAAVYAEALTHPALGNILVSRIDGLYDCDVVFPRELLAGMTVEKYYYSSELDMLTSDRAPHDCALPVEFYDPAGFEKVYLRIMEKLLNEAPQKQNRTETPTNYLVAQQLRFPLADGQGRGIWPLLTTKKMAWKTIVWELVWFLRGDTDAKFLRDYGVKIWDHNIAQAKLAPPARYSGDKASYVGEGYGYQWRYWDGGHDQIGAAVSGLKYNPLSRRILVTAWNPLAKTVLPPCHHAFQFVSDGRQLSCVVSMRSGDWFLGLPFNIASYGLLTHLIAKVVGLQPLEVIINVADAHLYKNHFSAADQQLRHVAKRSPRINFIGLPEDFDENDLADVGPHNIELEHYVEGVNCYGTIKAEIS